MDNNASTHVDSEVLVELLPLLNDNYGNPSSFHKVGQNAKEVLEIARKRVAALLGCNSENIIFTSGGTEGNNLAINGLANSLIGKHHFITSLVEHSSVLEVFHALEEKGHSVTYLSVDKNGLISPSQVEEAIKTHKNTALISLMLANNETGVIFPIREIGKIARNYNIPFHCDAVQGIGKMPINIEELKVDFLTISGHKIHAPKGAGALYIRELDSIVPLTKGGGQEKGKRSGTESLPAIVGLGKSCEITFNKLNEIIPKITKYRDLLEQGILKIMPKASINGLNSLRLCNTTNIKFSGIPGKELLEKLSINGIYISHGSACSNNNIGNSHVLKAMGLTDSEICSSIRFSLSKETTQEEITKVLKEISKILTFMSPKTNTEFVQTSNKLSLSENSENLTSYDMFENELQLLWSLTTGDPRICIAILDGQVDLSHPCFNGAQIDEVDSVMHSNRIKGAITHGTHVTSIILGQHSGGVHGIAPRCKGIILPIYSEDISGKVKCNQSDLARAIIRAVELGAHIINISGGQLAADGQPEHYLSDAIKYCQEKGVLIVAAAGNDGCRCLHVPAAAPSVLAVGAMDAHGSPNKYSNWGGAYQIQGILAPGENIFGAVPYGGVIAKSGTSFATAIVTGVISLLLSYQIKHGITPNPIVIRDALLNSASSCELNSNLEQERRLVGKLNISGTLERLLINASSKSLIDNSYDILSNLSENNLKMKGSSEFMNYEDNNTTTISKNRNDSNSPIDPNKNTEELKSCNVAPSDCGCNSKNSAPALVYALGNIGYDFGSEARRDSFTQMMSSSQNPHPNPYSPNQLLDYLEKNSTHAASLIWVLNQEATPIYAIQPLGVFGSEGYKILREFLKDMSDGISDIVSIPGIVLGNVTLMNGYTVPVIVPELRGMYNWSVNKLIESVLKKPLNHIDLNCQKDLQTKKDTMANFLKRVYYELRNFGITSKERALNYTGTNLAQIQEVLDSAILKNLSLDTIEAERSMICRPNSDCWDIKLTMFDPKNRLEKARIVYFFTLDVSDVVPVSIGTVRSWEIY
ncbi:MAG: PatA/PatG family cyanobactin maturation protease [Clostridium sp.]|uniref:PatA/PatG family cyanobactin maturation protease n=1 Tax=Clostridium sp. TaxID=1506 RepID=UPI003D6C92D7